MITNKIAICVFWEKNGILRDYVEYYLKGLQQIAKKILVVVNGKISSDSICKLKKLNIEYIKRENKGLDFAGYKAGIEHIGYDVLKEYDNLILTNTTCYGPIYPFNEMFDTMEKRPCDFWGITKHPKYAQMFEHIQSYFLVFKKNMFMNVEFQKYWKNLPKLSDYKKIVKILETKMTKYFENKGFISDSYIDVNLSLSNPMLKSYDLICNYKLPVIKRKEICGVFDVLINEQPSNQVNKVIAFLKNKTEYNTDMIYEDIINTQPMSEIQQCFRCNYILSNQYVEKEKANNCKIALILYIYYPDLVEYCYNYAKSMPEYSDIYIVVSREDTKKRCAEVFKNFPCNKLEIRVKPNRGRDVSAYLVTCKDVFAQYDYVCCMHDKKLQLLLISSSDMNFQNIVSNLV